MQDGNPFESSAPELEKNIKTIQLVPEKVITGTNHVEITIEERFAPFEEKAKEWLSKALGVVVTDENDEDGMAIAKQGEKFLASIRIAVEKTRVSEKKMYLDGGRFVDSVAKRLQALIEPAEKHLTEQANYKEVQEQKRKNELIKKRYNELLPFLDGNIIQVQTNASLGELSEEVYGHMLAGVKKAKEDRDAETERLRLEKVKDDEKRKETELYNSRIHQLTNLGAMVHDDKIVLLFEYAPSAKDNAIAVEETGKIGKMTSLEFQQTVERFMVVNNKIVAEAKRVKDEKEDKEKSDRKLRRGSDNTKFDEVNRRIGELKASLPTMKDKDAQEIIDNVSGLLEKIEKYITKNKEALQ